VAPAGGLGLGLVALRSYRKGEVVFTLEGRVRSAPYDEDYGTGATWFGIGRHRWIEPSPSNPGRFINHACRPNATFSARRQVVALRPIRRGEAVTMDYALTEEDPFWRLECRCGSRGCRKLIVAGRHFGKTAPGRPKPSLARSPIRRKRAEQGQIPPRR